MLFDGLIYGIADVTSGLLAVKVEAQRPDAPKLAKLEGERRGRVFVGGPMSAALLQL